MARGANALVRFATAVHVNFIQHFTKSHAKVILKKSPTSSLWYMQESEMDYLEPTCKTTAFCFETPCSLNETLARGEWVDAFHFCFPPLGIIICSQRCIVFAFAFLLTLQIALSASQTSTMSVNLLTLRKFFPSLYRLFPPIGVNPGRCYLYKMYAGSALDFRL